MSQNEDPNDYQTIQKSGVTTFGWIPKCPKCGSHGVSGYYGVKDSSGKAWALNICDRCGFKFKYPV